MVVYLIDFYSLLHSFYSLFSCLELTPMQCVFIKMYTEYFEMAMLLMNKIIQSSPRLSGF